jgi:hypothetical protein
MREAGRRIIRIEPAMTDKPGGCASDEEEEPLIVEVTLLGVEGGVEGRDRLPPSLASPVADKGTERE